MNTEFYDDLFSDILRERRITSDVAWASRSWNPTVAFKQTATLDGDEIKTIVLHSPYLRNIIHKIHIKDGEPLHKIYQNAAAILNTIGYHRHLPVIRWFGVFIAKLLKKLYSAVYVNEIKFLQIKSQMGNNPVLFVPSHKSYCDFVLMAYIFFHYEVDIPRIAAGMDFLSMAIIGNLLRSACAFFLRRSFIDDELYSSIFSQYVQTLITDGDGPVEFFIEGTRSRTAKSLFPKYGFLSMALRPFFFGLVPDIFVIPVTLNYDKILEEILFAYELLGIPKPKESTKGFIKALSILNENCGNVYVKFGNPISVKDFFGEHIDRSIHNQGPVHLQELSSNEHKQITNLAHTIVTKQRELIILNCYNLIAFVLNDNIMRSSEPMSLDELTKEVTWLFSMLKVINPDNSCFAMSDIIHEEIIHHLNLHESMVFLSPDKRIRLRKIFSRNGAINKAELKGHALLDSTLDVALPMIILQNYVNPCAFHVVPVSFIVLIFHALPRNSPLSLGALFKEFEFLCTLFAFEFVFYDEAVRKIYDEALKQCESLNLISITDAEVKKFENEKLHRYCLNFLKSFIPGYRIVGETLSKSIRENLSEGELLKLCQKSVESEIINRTLVHPNNLSLDLLKNALQTYASMKGITKVKRCTVTYAVNGAQMRRILTKLSTIEDSLKSDSSFDLREQFSNFTKSTL